MTGAAMVLLDDRDKVVAVSERRMTEHGASAYFKNHESLLPVVGAPSGFYTKPPLAQDLVGLAAVVKTFPSILSLVTTTSMAVYNQFSRSLHTGR